LSIDDEKEGLDFANYKKILMKKKQGFMQSLSSSKGLHIMRGQAE
jgi:hypothetical protein